MSYHTLRPRPNGEEEPEETELEVGASLTVGTVEVQRAELNLYVAECGMCGWRKKYPTSSPNSVNWDTFCHNRTRRKEGCPTNPTREE